MLFYRSSNHSLKGLINGSVGLPEESKASGRFWLLLQLRSRFNIKIRNFWDLNLFVYTHFIGAYCVVLSGVI